MPQHGGTGYLCYRFVELTNANGRTKSRRGDTNEYTREEKKINSALHFQHSGFNAQRFSVDLSLKLRLVRRVESDIYVRLLLSNICMHNVK